MRNRNIFWASAIGAIIALSAPQLALADVKVGIDAWEQGDFKTAVANWTIPAQSGDADAQFNLGQAYRFGRGVEMNLQVAENWYRRAARQGHIRAEDNLGLILFQKKDYEHAFPILEKSASRGDARAQYVLGTALFNGDLINKDWTRAYALMLRASANGLGRATSQLTEMNKYVTPDVQSDAKILAQKLAQREQEPKGIEVAAPALPPAEPPAPLPRDLIGAPTPVAQIESATPLQDPSGTITPTVLTPVAHAMPETVQASEEQPAPALFETAEASTDQKDKALAEPAPVMNSSWQAQMGAFANRENANRFLSQAKRKWPELASYSLTTTPRRDLTAIVAGPFSSRSEASLFCTRLRATGQACVPVVR